MNTFTCTVLIYVVLTVGLILTMLTKKVIFLDIGCVLAVICAILFIWSSVSTGVSLIKKQVSKPTEVATPSKYINKTYYIDNSKRLYIQQNDTTKPFGGDISSKIKYQDSAKEPSIEFKTIKSLGDPDDWNPFKFKHNVKTSISKVILPKSTLTQKLTKVDVVNPIQDSTDLTLTQ